jgi:hypothetical protein
MPQVACNPCSFTRHVSTILDFHLYFIQACGRGFCPASGECKEAVGMFQMREVMGCM